MAFFNFSNTDPFPLVSVLYPGHEQFNFDGGAKQSNRKNPEDLITVPQPHRYNVPPGTKAPYRFFKRVQRKLQPRVVADLQEYLDSAQTPATPGPPSPVNEPDNAPQPAPVGRTSQKDRMRRFERGRRRDLGGPDRRINRKIDRYNQTRQDRYDTLNEDRDSDDEYCGSIPEHVNRRNKNRIMGSRRRCPNGNVCIPDRVVKNPDAYYSGFRKRPAAREKNPYQQFCIAAMKQYNSRHRSSLVYAQFIKKFASELKDKYNDAGLCRQYTKHLSHAEKIKLCIKEGRKLGNAL
jgi:hypothetical protein